MIGKSKSHITTTAIFALSALVWVHVAHAEETNAADWVTLVQGDNTTISVDSEGSLTIDFATTGPGTLWHPMVAPMTAGNTPFNGDFVDANVQSINFTLEGSVEPGAQTAVIITCSNGNAWKNHNVSLGENSIGFSPGDWSFWLGTGEGFENDLANVDSIVIKFERNGLAAHSFTVAGFGVTSDGPIGHSDLEIALLRAFGVTTAAEVVGDAANVDSDGDGVSDLHELLAELEEGFAEANLVLEIRCNENNDVCLNWLHVEGKVYRVIRFSELGGDYTVQEVGPAPSTGKHGWGHTDLEAGNVGFYQVQQL